MNLETIVVAVIAIALTVVNCVCQEAHLNLKRSCLAPSGNKGYVLYV